VGNHLGGWQLGGIKKIGKIGKNASLWGARKKNRIDDVKMERKNKDKHGTQKEYF